MFKLLLMLFCFVQVYTQRSSQPVATTDGKIRLYSAEFNVN